MTDREVERTASFVAAHAELLFALGVAAAVAALSVVIAAVRILRRYRNELRRAFSVLVRVARAIDVVDRSIRRTRMLVPSGYLALHLALGLVLTAAAAFFVVVAEEVFGGSDLVAFDLAFARALRESASPGWERFFAAVSWLGEREAIAVATLAVAIRLFVAHDVVLAFGWIAAQAGGGLLNLMLKATFERTRPEFADPLLTASSWSFPSGHVMGTFILFGLGAYILLRNVRSWTVAAIVVTLSLLWCMTMAFSRLYLGVHFASDVIAGVVAGAAWVAVCASAFEMIRRRDGRFLSRASDGPGRERSDM